MKFIILFVFLTSNIFSQNRLVKNESFEDIDPELIPQEIRVNSSPNTPFPGVKYWYSTKGAADYYHKENTYLANFSQGLSIDYTGPDPADYLGYMGFAAIGSYYEAIEGELKETTFNKGDNLSFTSIYKMRDDRARNPANLIVYLKNSITNDSTLLDSLRMPPTSNSWRWQHFFATVNKTGVYDRIVLEIRSINEEENLKSYIYLDRVWLNRYTPAEPVVPKVLIKLPEIETKISEQVDLEIKYEITNFEKLSEFDLQIPYKIIFELANDCIYTSYPFYSYNSPKSEIVVEGEIDLLNKEGILEVINSNTLLSEFSFNPLEITYITPDSELIEYDFKNGFINIEANCMSPFRKVKAIIPSNIEVNSDELILKTWEKGTYKIDIFNLEAHTVKKYLFNNSSGELLIKKYKLGLDNGLYFLKIDSPYQSYTHKINIIR